MAPKKMARKKSGKRSGSSLLQFGIEVALGLGIAAVQALFDSPTTTESKSQPKAKPTAAKKRRTTASEPPPQEPTPQKPRQRKPPAWWKILGVSQKATREEITRAYRDLMTGCHPDKVAHLSPRLRKVAEREAKKLNAAREAALQDCNRR